MAGLLVCGASAAGCGGLAENDDTDDASYSATVRALTATEEFTEARLDARECIAEAGYPGDPSAEGVKLHDGTIYYSRGSKTITSAVLDYMVVRDRCSNETGLTGLADAAGVNPTPDLARAQGINKAVVQQMQCMAARGFEVTEPQMLNGSLIYPAPDGGPEVVAAYSVELMRCNQELWGTNGLGGY